MVPTVVYNKNVRKSLLSVMLITIRTTVREPYLDIHTYVLNAKNVNIIATQSLLVAVNRFFLKMSSKNTPCV